MASMKSCCCMRLNTAGVVIGWIGATISFITSVWLILALANIIQPVEYPDNANMSKVGIVTQLCLSIVILMASSLLVAGTMKERHLMLVPWLASVGVYLIILFIGILEIFINIVSGKPNQFYNRVFPIFILFFISLTLIWNAVHSLYKEIRANREGQRLLQNQNTPSYSKI